MSKNSYTKLLNNTLIFSVGNFGSKLITFFMVPLYTYYLTTTEFGQVDYLISLVNILVPVVGLCVSDAVLRFVMDSGENKEKIINNALLFTILISTVLLIITPIIKLVTDLDNLLLLMLIIIFSVFQAILSQYLRGIFYLKEYALNGIILAFLTAGLNIMFLPILDWGIRGYLLSLLIANLLSIMYMAKTINLVKIIDLSLISSTKIFEMIRYSIPLVPNTFMWQGINLVSKTFVISILGSTSMGVFAVSNKIPALLSIIQSIFTQAFQLSAIDEKDSANKTTFYSKTFNFYAFILLFSTAVLISVIKPFVGFFVATEYVDSWKYVPFLLLSVVYSSFSGFTGSFYISEKNTKGIFKTTAVGLIVSLVVNYFLIKIAGLQGSSLANMLSFLIIWIVRVIDTNKTMKIDYGFKKVSIATILIVIQILLTITEIQHIYFSIVIICSILLLYKSVVEDLVKGIIKK